jgi:membrane-associated phospholipid phosphatase
VKKKLAWAISRIFDPVFEIPLLLSASVWYALSNGMRWRFLLLLLIVDAVAPFAFMMVGLWKGFIKDWDMTDRKQRFGVYFFTILMHLFGVVLAYFLGKEDLFKILLIFWLLGLIFGIVTLYWKISVHAGTNAAIVAFFNHFYGWDKYWWLVLILILVLWSRVVIKKHTWMQVLVGSGVALAWVSLGLKLLF